MRTSISVVTTACVVAAIGCGGSTSPDAGPELRSITYKFCYGDTPAWFAHMDEGGGWTRVTTSGTAVTFQGTEKQAVAMAHTYSGSSEVAVVYTTATTLEKMACEQEPLFGTKLVKGSVTNLGGKLAFINIGLASGSAGWDGTTGFSVYGVGTGSQDLFATRRASWESPTDKMIIRRAQSYANNDSITLDFDGSDAFDLVSHAITTTGAGLGTTYVTQEFNSAGVSHDIQLSLNPASLLMLPAAKLASGELHVTTALAQDPSGLRGVIMRYAAPGAKTLAFGPVLPTPTFTTVSANPLLIKGQMVAPAEYGLGASIIYAQSDAGSYKTYEVTVLKDYLGATPATWVLEMPDLRGTNGFNGSWQFINAEYTWEGQLLDGTLDALADFDHTGEATVRFAFGGSEPFGATPAAGAPVPGSALRARSHIPRPRFVASRR